GDGMTVSRRTPVAVSGLTDAIALANSDGDTTHMCALRATGQVVCWGSNASASLGDGSTTARPFPVSWGTASNIASVSIGSANTCGVDNAGVAYCAGSNGYGQLGDGMPGGGAAYTPRRVAITGRVLQIAIGDVH